MPDSLTRAFYAWQLHEGAARVKYHEIISRTYSNCLYRFCERFGILQYITHLMLTKRRIILFVCSLRIQTNKLEKVDTRKNLAWQWNEQKWNSVNEKIVLIIIIGTSLVQERKAKFREQKSDTPFNLEIARNENRTYNITNKKLGTNNKSTRTCMRFRPLRWSFTYLLRLSTHDKRICKHWNMIYWIRTPGYKTDIEYAL
jgi:hypothetical protein